MSSTKINDYNKYLSRRSARRGPSAIRTLVPLTKLPGMISLGVGAPNPITFPYEKVTIALKDGTTVDLSGDALYEGLQYSSSYGLPPLVDWIKKNQASTHKPTLTDWNVMVTTGSQDALNIAFDMLLNEYDSILTESPTYVGVLAGLAAFGGNVIGIETDGNGLIPSALEKKLENWDKALPVPRVLYIIPTAQNPAGTTIPLERKQQIYQIASKYDLIIIEDDPYYFLSFSDEPLRSFFSMDVDGRVLRFDSFSKVLSGGLRLGWVTGPSPLVERMQFHQQACALHTSGMSQVVALTTLQAWEKNNGWETHLTYVKNFYRKRRDIFLELAEKYLKGLAEWNTPVAGMFVWFKLLSIDDSFSLIMEKAVSKKVLLVPGQHFMPDNKPCPYVRASYSIASPEEMEEALKRLAALLREQNHQQ